MPNLGTEVSRTQSITARGKSLIHHTYCFPSKLTKYFVTRKLINWECWCPIGESFVLLLLSGDEIEDTKNKHPNLTLLLIKLLQASFSTHEKHKETVRFYPDNDGKVLGSSIRSNGKFSLNSY